MFVLRRKGTLDFICTAKTLEDLNSKINEKYWGVKGCASKGSVFEMSDFMKDKVISDIKWRDLTPCLNHKSYRQ